MKKVQLFKQVQQGTKAGFYFGNTVLFYTQKFGYLSHSSFGCDGIRPQAQVSSWEGKQVS